MLNCLEYRRIEKKCKYSEKKNMFLKMNMNMKRNMKRKNLIKQEHHLYKSKMRQSPSHKRKDVAHVYLKRRKIKVKNMKLTKKNTSVI